MPQDKARIKARFAVLLDHFHLTLPEVAGLTDGQINALYFHARDEQTGAIKPPRAVPRTPEEDYRSRLLALEGLFAARLITRANFDECAAGLRKKFGIAEPTGGGNER